jgi:hypothetical protein
MLTDEEEQMLQTFKELEKEKKPIMIWQWAAITILEAAKERVPKGMKPEDFYTFHRLNIKRAVHRIELTAEETAQLMTLNEVLCHCIEQQDKREYEEYMEGPPIEPVRPFCMYINTKPPPPQRW